MEMERGDWWVVARGQTTELMDVIRRVQALKNPTPFDYAEIEYRIGEICKALAEIYPQGAE